MGRIIGGCRTFQHSIRLFPQLFPQNQSIVYPIRTKVSTGVTGCTEGFYKKLSVTSGQNTRLCQHLENVQRPPVSVMGRNPAELAKCAKYKQPLCGRAVYVIQKNHLFVIIRLFKPIYNERKGNFHGQ